jgi:RNA polymerase sigma-70 factor, ECF subfamily
MLRRQIHERASELGVVRRHGASSGVRPGAGRGFALPSCADSSTAAWSRLMALAARSAHAPSSDTFQREREWVARIREGDEQAFEAMFRTYNSALVSFAGALLRSRDSGCDVVQDVFLRIWNHRHGWAVPGALRTYLFRAVRNRAVDELRHGRMETRLADRRRETAAELVSSAHAASPEERVDARDFAAAVARILDALPERCREAFVLSRHHQLTNAEVADVMGISVKTVEMQMTRALSALRLGLKGW